MLKMGYRGVRVEDEVDCCNNLDERFLKFIRELFYKNIEKLN